MTDLIDTSEWVEGIRQVETTDAVQGGLGGVDNIAPLGLAKRTRFVYDRTTALASLADLLPIPVADGLVRFVRGVGLYVFVAASVLPEEWPWVVDPDVGPGQWIHELYFVQGGAFGLARLDTDARLIVNGATLYPRFETARTLQRFSPPATLGYTTGWQHTSTSSLHHALQGPATGLGQYIPLEVHDGATLATIDIHVRITPGAHANLPAVFPKFRVRRIQRVPGINPSVAGYAELRADSAYAVIPTPANVAAYDSSNVQSWTYTPDQNNVIDRSQYLYVAEVYDENGANSVAGNFFYGFILHFSGIADMRFA